MRPIDEIEQQLRAAVDGSTLVPDVPELRLPGLPDAVWSGNGPTIAGVQIERAGERLTLSGRIELDLLGGADIVVIFNASDTAPHVELKSRADAPLVRVLGRLMGGLSDAAARGLDGVTVQAVSWGTPAAEGLAGLELLLTLSGSASFSIGVARGTLALTRASAMVGSGAGAAHLAGALGIFGLSAPVEVALGGGLRISGQLPGLDLRRLAGALSLALPSLPRLPLLDAPLREVQIDLGEGEAHLSAALEVGALGKIRATVARIDGSWGLVAGVHARKNFSFADLDEVLRPLDPLCDLIDLNDPALVLSTLTSTGFPYPDGTGGWSPLAVREGGVLSGELRLQGPLLGLVGAVLRRKTLPMLVPLEPDWSKLRISAALGGRLVLIPKCLTIEAFRVEVSAAPFALSAAGDVTIQLFGLELPRFVLAANLAAGTASLSFTAAEPWRKPLGLPFDVQKLGFESDGASFAVFGAVAIQQRSIAVAAQFVGEVPVMLAGEFKGEVSLAGVLKDLLGVSPLPAFVTPKLRDFHVFLVLSPAGAATVAGQLPKGLSLAGSLEIFGLAASMSIQVSGTRVFAKGALTRPLRLDPVLRITGAGTAATPALTIDTTAKQVVQLTGRVACLGIQNEVTAVLAKDGFSFSLAQTVGKVRARLDATLAGPSFRARGSAAFVLKASIGPLSLGGLNLGTIHLDTGVTAQIVVSMSAGKPPELKVSATFVFMKVTLRLPEVAVAVTTLDKLPAPVLQAIRTAAVDIFGVILKSVDQWVLAVAAGAIGTVSDAARVLHDHFKRGVEDVARAYRQQLKQTIEETAKALKRLKQTPKQIAKIFKDIGETPAAIGAALRAINVPAKTIAGLLQGLGFSKGQIREVLKVLNFPTKVIEDVIGGIFDFLGF